jgi:N-acetylmuramoyl-L-alanine amidase
MAKRRGPDKPRIRRVSGALKRLESAAGFRRMLRVLKPGPILICFLIGVTGCATGPREARNRGAVAGSNAAEETAHPPEQIERVPTGPQLAPPATTLPEWSPSQARGYADTWISLGRWSRESGYGTLRQVAFGPAPAFALSTTTGVFFLRIHSLVANWNGLELHLGFEPQLINDRPFVHFLDLKKTLEPLLRGFTSSSATNRTVVIDPGHGGQNTGTISVTDGVYEKEYTLDWACRLESLLATNGWQVFLTRMSDIDVSLSNRVALAEEHKADLFISLHFNSAAPSQEQTGLETYCLTPAGMPSTLTRGYDDDPALAFANNAFDTENLQYAVLLHRALLTVVRNDRGVRHARFLGVLRGQNRPAILIEGGYLSNPAESRRIADPAYRQKLAEAVAAALDGTLDAGGQRSETGSRVAGVPPPASECQPPASDSQSSNSIPEKGQFH